MRKNARFIALIVCIIAVGLALWWWLGRARSATELLLYGNVDLRQVELPFNGSERVAEVLVQEGDRVSKGQILARLDTARLAPQLAKAEAEVAVQSEAVARLHHGNRPEEIAQSQASLAAAAADADNARAQLDRLRSLSDSSSGRGVSRQEMDSAKAALDMAEARLAVSRKALTLEHMGARKEDIAQAEAQLRADQAQLALVQQQFKDAALVAPLGAVVRSRIIEPGEMATPQRAAFTLAITDPKWVRVYVAETNLGSINEGKAAVITVDAFPNRSFPGRVGYISSVAEFTPKSVETSELRSSLVYEVRVFVTDPEDELRLGMPATVHVALRTGSGAPHNP